MYPYPYLLHIVPPLSTQFLTILTSVFFLFVLRQVLQNFLEYFSNLPGAGGSHLNPSYRVGEAQVGGCRWPGQTKIMTPYLKNN
jgi:hypothetical protein